MRLLQLVGLSFALTLLAACGDSFPKTARPEARPSAIVNGELDDGDFPQVGTLVRRFPVTGGNASTPSNDADPFSSRCSGTLIAPRVFLTAGHCIFFFQNAGVLPGQWGVSFDRVFVPGVSEVLFGTAYLHPGFNIDLEVNDTAVVVLDKPVKHLKPKKLAPLNILEKTSARRLAEATIITVGYGMSDPDARTGRGTRRVAPQRFLGLDGPSRGIPYYNFVNTGGAFEDGYGATCQGDSGGPHFLNGKIIGTTTDISCFGDPVDAAQRVDIAPVRSFIMSFLDEDEDE